MPFVPEPGLPIAEGGVVAARGFLASGTHCGMKKEGRKDLALIVAEKSVPAAAVFTTNVVAAAPVNVSRKHIASGTCRAVIINSGNANACTGPKGEEDAVATAKAVAEKLGSSPEDVIVCSTGVIGVPMPIDVLVAGIGPAVDALDDATGDDAAAAIMTTDTFAKQSAVTVEVDGRHFTVGGMAKGSGMIAPNMATMLSVITTDAPLTPEACDAALRSATALTFNRVSVDSDTSTNDTAVLMASGAAGGEPIEATGPAFDAVSHAIHVVCAELATMLVRDGEGATKLVTVTVSGAANPEDAEKAARAIADSPLVKTAIFGRDANWGRVAMAVGKSGAVFEQSDLAISFAGIPVCENGTAVPFDEDEALEALSETQVTIEVSIGAGEGSATILTCDLSYEYVRINGEYRS